MNSKLSRRETVFLLAVTILLVSCSVWENRRLRAAQLEEQQALYAERLRTAQVVLENEMLAAAYLTSSNARTRERARFYLERSPW